MTRIASHDLRTDTAGILRRAAAGELIEITVNGEAIARITPLSTLRSSWMSRAEFVAKLVRTQADPGLKDDLATLDAGAERLGPIR